MVIRITPALVALACFLAVWGLPGLVTPEETDPTITLVKTIEVREFENLKFNVDEYTVVEGDSVVKVLRRRGVIGSGPTSAKLVKIIQALNPALTNPDLIIPGQKLVLPVDPIEGLNLDTATNQPKAPQPNKESGPSPAKTPPTQTQPAPAKAEEATTVKIAPPKPAETKTPPLRPADTAAKALSPEPAPLPETPSQSPQNINIPELARAALTDPGKHKTIVVEKGDRLANILRRENIPEDLIFNEFITLTVVMNPGLANPNLLYAGLELKVPLRPAWGEVAVVNRPGTSPLPSPLPPVPPTATRVKPQPETVAKAQPSPPLAPPPPMPPGASLATRTALALIFSRLGDNFLASGQHFLPLKTGGQIIINTQSFPILELRNGHRIIIDLEERLPTEVVEMIRSNWSNYSIFRSKKGENLGEILGRLFSEGQYFRVHKRGTPWVLDREVRVKIEADYIVWPTADDWTAGRATVITFPETQGAGTNPELAAFLAQMGVKIIDYHSRGHVIGPEPRSESGAVALPVEDWRPENYNEFAKAILNLVGQPFESDMTIPLTPPGTTGQDFNITVQAPIFFSRLGGNYIVLSSGLTPEMQKMLENQRYTVIYRRPGESAQGLALKILSAIGIKTENGLIVTGYGQSGSRNIELTWPGVLFKNGGMDLLLTAKTIPATLSPLINRPNLKVVRYTISNPT